MNLRIKKNALCNIYIIVSLIAIFEPAWFVGNHLIHLICQFIVTVDFVYYLYKYLNKHKFNKITLYTVIYSLYILINSLLHGSLELSVLRIYMSLITIALIFAIYDYKELSKCYLFCFLFLLSANLIWSCFINPSIDFLTGGNALVIYCIPALCISLSLIEIKEKLLLSIITIFLVIISAMLVDVATLKFVVFAVLSAWILEKILKKNIFSLGQIITVLILLFIVVIVMQAQDKLFLIKYIIVELLQRDISFTSRTYVWRESIKQFLGSPMFGYGFGYSFRVPVLNSGFWADHCHNHYLQQLIQGGVVQLYLFLLILKQMIKPLKNIIMKKIFWINCIVFMTGIMFMFESYTSVTLYSTVFLIYYCCQ